jgi:hypothetical protein
MNDVPRGLLRETLRGRMTPDPAAGCLDGEALAAWSEGTLDGRARDAVERHAADCARCQALLAAMARTEPQPSPSRWWRPSTFGWLAPLAAAAAAILIWINLPPSSIDRAVDTTRVAKSVALPRDATLPAPAQPAPIVTVPERIAAAPADKRRPAAGGRVAPRSVPSPPRVADQTIDAISQTKDAPQASPLAGSKGAPAETRETVTAPPAPAGAVAGGLPRRDETLTSVSKIQPPETSGFAGITADSVLRRALVPVDVVSPNPRMRWRLLPAGQVARSIDRGVTWQTQSTGVPITLTAGAAPAPTVCWLVGPGGVVVLTTDGVTWRRLAFPDASDLIAVRATDAVNATVTTADGRTFRTTDGGKSWRQP